MSMENSVPSGLKRNVDTFLYIRLLSNTFLLKKVTKQRKETINKTSDLEKIYVYIRFVKNRIEIGSVVFL